MEREVAVVNDCTGTGSCAPRCRERRLAQCCRYVAEMLPVLVTLVKGRDGHGSREAVPVIGDNRGTGPILVKECPSSRPHPSRCAILSTRGRSASRPYSL